jgi:hypothetical protein
MAKYLYNIYINVQKSGFWFPMGCSAGAVLHRELKLTALSDCVSRLMFFFIVVQKLHFIFSCGFWLVLFT